MHSPVEWKYASEAAHGDGEQRESPPLDYNDI